METWDFKSHSRQCGPFKSHRRGVETPSTAAAFRDIQFKSHRRGVETLRSFETSTVLRRSNHTVAVWKRTLRLLVPLLCVCVQITPSRCGNIPGSVDLAPAGSNHTVAVWKPHTLGTGAPLGSSNHTVAVWKQRLGFREPLPEPGSNHTVAVWKRLLPHIILVQLEVQITPSRCGNLLPFILISPS